MRFFFVVSSFLSALSLRLAAATLRSENPVDAPFFVISVTSGAVRNLAKQDKAYECRIYKEGTDDSDRHRLIDTQILVM